jgi:hypothetical protein
MLDRSGKVERYALNRARVGMLADYWFWIFRDPFTGLRRSTGRRMTSGEARDYPMAQAVPSTLRLRDSDTDFEDTAPLVFHDVPRQ